jgi:hypothetical protein
MGSSNETTLAADETLLRLEAGNERFVAGTAQFFHGAKETPPTSQRADSLTPRSWPAATRG